MISIQKRKQNWIEFYDLTGNVNRLLMINCSEIESQRPPFWWEKIPERTEWAYETYQKRVESLEWLHDNTVPFLSMLTGTEIFAEAFGCSVHKPDDMPPFALPLVFSVKDLHKVKFPKIEDTKLSLLFDMADKLKARAGKDAVLGLPDVQTPMDIAALIWEKVDFFSALYEEPEAVKELTLKIKLFMFDFFDEWFRRYGKELSAHFPNYYMPFGITMSEDEVGVVSSDTYKEFFEKELHEFSERYGQIGIHCCANAKHQWENFKNIPNLKLLNIGASESQQYESASFFKDVCAQYPLWIETDISTIEDNDKIHFVTQINVDTKQEAIEAVTGFNNLIKKT